MFHNDVQHQQQQQRQNKLNCCLLPFHLISSSRSHAAFFPFTQPNILSTIVHISDLLLFCRRIVVIAKEKNNSRDEEKLHPESKQGANDLHDSVPICATSWSLLIPELLDLSH